MPSRLATVAALAAVVTIGTSTPALAATAGTTAAGTTAAGTTAAGTNAAEIRLGRQTLPANDGWASTGTGTTGGSAADAAHVLVAHTRAELAAAVAGDTPKIVYVSGRIDLRVDAANQPVGCDAFADPDYNLADFLAAYDPAVWGRATKPSGPLEDARVRSAKNQGDTVKINVGSNTTIIGIDGAHLLHGSLVLSSVSNVILRNLHVSDAADCFPAWDPTDGDTGNWNSLYDLISLTGATNVWIDHNTLDDGDNPDSDQPTYLGRPYQVHDGASDIIKASDLVTVSWNSYANHDKTMLIGSTDTVGVDVGKLRVTVHHNKFDNVLQRGPRVRFGQVDVYDNYYRATDPLYQYSLGVGVQSAIYAQNNYFTLGAGTPVGNVIHYWKGTQITAIGSLVNGKPVDLVAAYNTAYDPDLSADAGWTPTARTHVDPAWLVPVLVTAYAGTRL